MPSPAGASAREKTKKSASGIIRERIRKQKAVGGKTEGYQPKSSYLPGAKKAHIAALEEAGDIGTKKKKNNG